MGKGSTPRPLAVDDATYADRWARTFGPAVAEPETPRPTVLYVTPEESDRLRRANEAERSLGAPGYSGWQQRVGDILGADVLATLQDRVWPEPITVRVVPAVTERFG